MIERLSAPPSPIAHSSEIAHVRDQEDDGIILAYELIKNIELTPKNFSVAWKKLEQRYENMLRLVNIHLNSLLSIKAVTAETSAETKRLLEGTLGPFTALRSLDQPCDHLDEIIVFLTFSKLSPELKRE